MVDQKAKEEHERLKTRERVAGIIIVVIMMVGAGVMLFGMFANAACITLVDDEHLTDDGIAYRDMDNATYTYTAEELLEKGVIARNLILVGAGIALAGLAAMNIVAYINPANTSVKAHKIYCDGNGEHKHCPECGLKLSKLEKD